MTDAPVRDPASVASEISAFMVRTTRDFTGRGPTRTRTYVTDTLVTVVLEDVLSKGERSLVALGREEEVRQMRHAFQEAMKPTWISGIEALVGRPVVAFLSANHLDPDIAIESFVLDRAP